MTLHSLLKNISQLACLTTFATLAIFPIGSNADAPLPIQGMAYARVGSELFVQGGYVAVNDTQTTISGQFYALDLSTSWPTSSPPWRALPTGNPAKVFYGAATPDNQTFVTFTVLPTSYTASIFDIQKNSWSNVDLTNTDSRAYGVFPVMDSSTGLANIVGTLSVNAYNINSNSWTVNQIPTGMLSQKCFGAGVYNKVRKSIMYFGGYDYTVAGYFEPTAFVTEYVIAQNQWSVFTTSGSIPSPRVDFCMAISEDSNTIVVFGGRTSLNPPTFSASIYMLNITSGTWTQGPAQSSPRLYPACTIVGTQFVAWGGSDGNNTSSGTPLVFDLGQKQWVNSYTAPAYYLNAPKTTSSSATLSTGSRGPTTTPSSTGSTPVPIAGIVGGIVGALMVGISGATLFYRRKRKIEKVKNEELAQRKMFNAAERTDDDDRSGMMYHDSKRTTKTIDSFSRDFVPPPPQTPKLNYNGNNPHTMYTNAGARNPEERMTPQMMAAVNHPHQSDYYFDDVDNMKRNPHGEQEVSFYHDQESSVQFRGPQMYSSAISLA